MILKQLNFSYLTRHLGVDIFNLFKSTFEAVSEDGHFENNFGDKEIACLLFEQTIPDNFLNLKPT